MARFLFSTAPLPGHIDWGGLLQTAVYLQASGHEVRWASGAAIQPQLAAAGIPFQEVPVAYDPPKRLAAPTERTFAEEMQLTMDVWLEETAVAAATDAHLDLIHTWRPDVVIADPLVLAAALASEVACIPLAGCGYPGAFATIPNQPPLQHLAIELARRKNWLRQRFSLPPESSKAARTFLFVASRLHLVFFTASWFADYNPAPSPGAQYLGGQSQPPQTEAPDWLKEVVGKRPLIAIAQSTTYGSLAHWLPHIFQALTEIGATGILAADEELIRTLPALPDHIYRVPWIPYEHLLPHVTALIHHGGTGTTHKAICHGVPQLILPQVADQFIHAMAVERHGNGKMLLPWRTTPSAIWHKLQDVATSEQILQAAQNLRRHFSQLGGISRAAELLLVLAQTPA